MMTTVKPAPATRTRTSASPGPMERTGTSSRRSAPPSWRSTIAFIRRGALTPTTPLKPGRAPPRLQNTSARGPPTRCCDWLEVVRVEAADQIGMAVDGEVVVDVRDRAAAGGHAEDAALDEDYLAAGRAGRRPGEHRVLEDHAAGEVPELAEVRVVDLDEEPEILAHVAVEGEARAAHEHVRGPAGAVRRAVLVEQGVCLDVDPEVQVHALNGHGQLDCVSGEWCDGERSYEKGLPGSPHSRS